VTADRLPGLFDPQTAGGSAEQGEGPAAPPAPLVITVHGRPITQGSKVKVKWGQLDANWKTLRPWRDNVRSAALEARGDTEPILGPVEVDIVFTFDRPAGHFGTGRNAGMLKASSPAYPANLTSGDIDKLQRSCFDALTDAQVWKDDAQVVRVEADKLYAGHQHALAGPGCVIHVRPMP
jgi:Holliday junction resolvase RusA-like endonuclease